MNSLYQRLIANWVYGGFLSSFALITLGCVLLREYPPAFLLLFLHLPVYQIHQLEEHDRDRFRRYMNEKVGRGLEILTATAVFWINIGLVWALFSFFISIALINNIGWGLPVVYATLFNALIHIGSALKSREYNPGLITSVILFLPLSIITLSMISNNPAVSGLQQFTGVAIGNGIHLGIIAYCAARGRMQSRLASASPKKS